MMDVAWMYGDRSLPNTQPQNWTVSQSWAGRGEGSRVSPCPAGDMEGRMKSSQWPANPKTKERRKETRYAFPAPYPKLSIKQRQSSPEEVEAGQEQHADSCPSLWNHEV